MTTTVNCRDEACRFLTKSDICGLLAINVDLNGVCMSQQPHPPEPGTPLEGLAPLATQ